MKHFVKESPGGMLHWTTLCGPSIVFVPVWDWPCQCIPVVSLPNSYAYWRKNCLPHWHELLVQAIDCWCLRILDHAILVRGLADLPMTGRVKPSGDAETHVISQLYVTTAAVAACAKIQRTCMLGICLEATELIRHFDWSYEKWDKQRLSWGYIKSPQNLTRSIAEMKRPAFESGPPSAK
jgi:hypothetical protein